jgi:RNA polymerase sigma factor (sigma-70 family)
MSGVIRHLRRVALLPDGGGMTDGQLLESFITRRDEAAFEVLVRRHGPMVLGVCLRVLRNAQDAEDAFQATFLVLVRKATSIGQRELVGNWLYGAAYRAALEAKAARRRVKERQVSAMPEPEAAPEAEGWLELRALLDQELHRLPDKYRVPVVLCDLEGRTRREVAQQLKIPAGTLSSRLTTARRLLAKRLARHGFAVAGGALAAALSPGAASACVPSPLVASTVKAATLLAAGQAASAGLIPAQVAALTEGVLKTMLLTRLKMAMAVLLLAGILAGGVATLVRPAPAAGPTEAKKEEKKGAKKEVSVSWKERLCINAPEVSQAFALAVSPDGKRIAVCYGTVTSVLDAKTGKELVTLSGTEKAMPGRSIAFSPDGKLIAQSGDYADVLLCSADSGEVKATLEYAKGVVAVAFSPDGKTLATAANSGGGEGSEVRLWDLATNKVIREFNKLKGPREDKEPGAWSIAFSRDGKKLATAQGSDRTAKVWDVETGKELATFGKHPGWVVAVAFSPDGKTVAAANAGKDPQVKLWDLATGKERFTLKSPTCAYRSLAFSPDGKILAVAGEDDRDEKNAACVVRLWNPATGKQIADLDMQGDRTNWGPSLAFSRNGILVTANDAAVRIWEPEKGPATNKK